MVSVPPLFQLSKFNVFHAALDCVNGGPRTSVLDLEMLDGT